MRDLQVAERPPDGADPQAVGRVDECCRPRSRSGRSPRRWAGRRRRRTPRSRWTAAPSRRPAPGSGRRGGPAAWRRPACRRVPRCTAQAGRHLLAGELQRVRRACRPVPPTGRSWSWRRPRPGLADRPRCRPSRRSRGAAHMSVGRTHRQVRHDLVDPTVHIGRAAPRAITPPRASCRTSATAAATGTAGRPEWTSRAPTAPRASQHQPACSSSTPFGRPVVPEV